MSTMTKEGFYQLIYVSEPVAGIPELLDIVAKAQVFNSSKEISGILIVKNKSVFQLLEGPENEVRALYEKIKQDPRHRSPDVIYEGITKMRNIPFLGMALTIDFEENDDHKVFLFDKKEAIKFSQLIKGPVKEYLLSYLNMN